MVHGYIESWSLSRLKEIFTQDQLFQHTKLTICYIKTSVIWSLSYLRCICTYWQYICTYWQYICTYCQYICTYWPYISTYWHYMCT